MGIVRQLIVNILTRMEALLGMTVQSSWFQTEPVLYYSAESTPGRR